MYPNRQLMQPTSSFLNTAIHNLTMDETVQVVEEAIEQRRQIHHVAVNAGKIVQMQGDAQLRESVNNSDIINADGSHLGV